MEEIFRKIEQEEANIQNNIHALDKRMEIILNCARDLGELRQCGREEEARKGERVLRESFAKIARSRHVLVEYLKVSDSVKNDLRNFESERMDNTDESTMDEEGQVLLEKLLHHASDEMSRFAGYASDPSKLPFNIEDDPKYALFTEKLSGELKETVNEDGLVVMPTKINVICPITRQLIEDPVKNPVCGHSYSKRAVCEWITSELQSKGSAQCPVAGCQASLNIRGLKRDTEVQHELLRLKLRPTPDELASQHSGSATQAAPDDADMDLL